MKNQIHENMENKMETDGTCSSVLYAFLYSNHGESMANKMETGM